MKTDYKQMLYKILILCIFAVGIAVRLIELASYPKGLNADEAFAGYEAYSLLNFGIDSHGYHFPVYLVAWGSGMNALYSYLCIPFIWLFGLTPFVTRLPQVLMSIITLFVLYKLIKKGTDNRKFILISTFLLAVNPWHIMMSRWGLESNLVVSFLVLGLYFWVLGLENNRYFMLSALFYGLSLYCYATIWLVVPIILVLQLVYCRYVKKLYFNKYILFSGIIVLILAAPLLLFLAVNAGIIGEIRSFISIPKLVSMRSGELADSLREVGERFFNFFKLVTTQDDGWGHSALPEFGLYYKFSLPFIFVGLICIIKNMIKTIKEKAFSLLSFVFIQIAACLPIMLLIEVNANKINCIHIPLIICCAYGIFMAGKYVWNSINPIAVCAYAVAFAAFCGAYFNSGIPDYLFYYGYENALSYTREISNGRTICVNDINYPVLMYAEKTNVHDFIDTVKYGNYPSEFLEVNSFSDYVFNIDSENPDTNNIYLFGKSNSELKDILKEKEFTVEDIDEYTVAYYGN